MNSNHSLENVFNATVDQLHGNFDFFYFEMKENDEFLHDVELK